MTARPSIHANCVVAGEAGVLIRGASGAGKSRLSEAIIERAQAKGLFARLVADDRTLVAAHGGRLVARAPAAIAGLIERRGVGICQTPHLSAAVVRLVVDIEPDAERLPTENARRTVLDGIDLPRLVTAPRDPEAAGMVLACADLARHPRRCVRFALAFAPQHGKIASGAWDAPFLEDGRARAARDGRFSGAQ